MNSIEDIRKKCPRKINSIHEFILHHGGIYLAKLFLFLPFSPNQITIMWFVMQLASCLLFLKGSMDYMIIGVLIFQLINFLDYTDGIVARYRNESSVLGVYLDEIAHKINIPFFWFCFGIGTAKLYNNKIYFIIGLTFALVFCFNKMLSINPLWFEKEYGKKLLDKLSVKVGSNWLYDFIKVQNIGNLLFFMVLFNQVGMGIIIYFIITSLFFIRNVIKNIRFLKGK